MSLEKKKTNHGVGRVEDVVLKRWGGGCCLGWGQSLRSQNSGRSGDHWGRGGGGAGGLSPRLRPLRSL